MGDTTKTIINIGRAIIALGIGIGVAYLWDSIRKDEFTVVLGIGIVTTVFAFLVLYFVGKKGE